MRRECLYAVDKRRIVMAKRGAPPGIGLVDDGIVKGHVLVAVAVAVALATTPASSIVVFHRCFKVLVKK